MTSPTTEGAQISAIRAGDPTARCHVGLRSSHGGALISGTPLRIRISQPEVSIVRWWNQQSNTPLSVWVPSGSCARGVTWWTSHHPAGTWHPGIVQPPSRSAMARRWLPVKHRSGDPSWRMRPLRPKTTRSTAPAQPMWRAAAMLMGVGIPSAKAAPRPEDLASGRGAAFADGIPTPISIAAARHIGCAGAVERVVFGRNGRILQLGSPERCFTGNQRRAIALRDGGCTIPGCHVPAGWCEVHHVTPRAHDPDGTHTDNGVLLCWFHHRTIDTSGWEIRMRNGVPEIKAPPWLDRSPTWRRAVGSPARIAEWCRIAEICAPPRR